MSTSRPLNGPLVALPPLARRSLMRLRLKSRKLLLMGMSYPTTGSGHSMTGADATFRMVRFRPLIIAFFVLMSCIAVLLLLSLRGNTNPLLAVFIALWLGEVALTDYWFLF